jgi:mono/diheme cytochrome c family protein
MGRRAFVGLALAGIVSAAGAAAWLWRGAAVPQPAPPVAAATPDATTIARGAQVARAGNCLACHTARGSAKGAGGRPITTPFGTVYSANLTPDDATGLGRWAADDLWRALHEGRSRDGRRLVPACPYPSFTHVTRADIDALHAWLRTLPPAQSPNRAHELRFPYQTQWALAAWQFLFFEPGEFTPRADRSAEWNRGAYLVRGLGHCAECHAPRNAFGALRDAESLAGARMAGQAWYAPSLAAPDEAGVTAATVDDVVALLQHGISRQGSAAGPMAEVVAGSTSHLPRGDLRAIAVYLADLPRPSPRDAGARPVEAAAGQLALGRAVYEKHCADCHGEAGEGRPGAYPALAGNRAVALADPLNVLRAILGGGFAPTTAGNPRPHGMPPYASVLDDAEVAAVASYIRSTWGNAARPVGELEVLRLR